MNPPLSQANRSGRTPWSVPFLCAVLLSIPAHAIEVRIDPPEKTIRGLRGLFHRTVKQPRDTVDQARALARSLTQGPEAARSGRTQQVARTPDSASSSRRAASRQQDAVTLDEQRSTAERSKKVERPKSSTSANRDEPAAPPASESESAADSTPSGSQPQVSPSSPMTPPPAQTVAFARPVPGKKGIVYPPGVGESLDTEVDVSELQPGELARDPRSGVIFRVP